MSKQKTQLTELSYFNAIACLMVVLIHVLSYGIQATEKNSWQYLMIYIPWRLSAFVVPAFLFSGAVKVSRNMPESLSLKQYIHYIGRRFQKIYLPYLLWNCVYYAAFIRIGYVSGSWQDFLGYLLRGNLSSPFYYVIIVMQFYLLLPLWLWMLRNVRWYTAMVWAAVIQLLSVQAGSVLAQFGVQFAFSDRIFTSYLVFWTTGLYVGQNYEQVSQALLERKKDSGAAVILVFAACLLAYLNSIGTVSISYMDCIKIAVDLSSIFLLLRVCIGLKQAPKTVRKVLTFVSGASFSVYLSHCLFLTLTDNKLHQLGITRISTNLAIRFFVCYSVPFVLYAIWHCGLQTLRKARNKTPDT